MKKNSRLIYLISGIMVAISSLAIVICIFLFLLGSDFKALSTSQLLIITIISIAIDVVFLILGSIADKINKTYCTKCKESMNGCKYSCQQISRKILENANISYKMYINAVCPKCGTVKTFKQSFICKPGESIDFKVDRFLQKTFGH